MNEQYSGIIPSDLDINIDLPLIRQMIIDCNGFGNKELARLNVLFGLQLFPDDISLTRLRLIITNPIRVVLTQKRNFVDHTIDFVKLCFDCRMYELASANIAFALSKHPDDPYLLSVAGHSSLLSQDYEKAKSLLHKVESVFGSIEDNYLKFETYTLLAKCYLKSENGIENLHKYLNCGLEIENIVLLYNHVWLYYQRALLHRADNNFQKMGEDISEALNLLIILKSCPDYFQDTESLESLLLELRGR
jgi:tetratricopeptide (TPR) repeat protein